MIVLKNLMLFAICFFAATSPFLRADDLEEKLKNEPIWLALEPELGNVDKEELKGILRILLCQAVDRPPLDPAKALDKATKKLHDCMKELVNAVEVQTEVALLTKLTPLLSEERVNPTQLDEPYRIVTKAIHEQSGNSSKLVLYAKLARAIEGYTLLVREEYKTPSDYSKLLTDFKRALFDYVSAPRGETERNKLGIKVALLEAFADADKTSNFDDLLIAIRKVCKRPNFWLQVSDRLINDLLNSAVNPISDSQCVAECILDTSITGTAVVSANASVSTTEASDRAVLKVNLNGSSTSDTIGYHKPVNIKSVGNTNFSAEKTVCISDAAFTAGQSAAVASTDTTICSIAKVGRPFLRKVIERVAWKRACQQKSQAEFIASQKFECKLEAAFDQRLDSALVKARAFYDERVRSPLAKLGILPKNLSFSSTSKSVSVGATLAKPEMIGAPNAPKSLPASSLQSDLTLRIHDSLLMSKSPNHVPPEVLDRLINEFLSNIRGVNKGTKSSSLDPKVFNTILELPMSDSGLLQGKTLEDVLKSKLPKNDKLEFSGVTYEDGWISLNWRLKK